MRRYRRRGIAANHTVAHVTAKQLLYALAILAVVAILSPRTFLMLIISWAVIYLVAPPEWKRPPTPPGDDA